MFVKKNDPLLESVQSVMRDNDLRRRLEDKLNEELGIACKKALPHEYHEEYDQMLADAIEEAKREPGRPGYIKSLKVANHNNRGNFAVPAALSAAAGAGLGGASTGSKAGALAGAALGVGTVALAHTSQIRKDAKMLRGTGNIGRSLDATKADVNRYEKFKKKPLHKRLAVRLKAMTGNTDHLYDEEVEQIIDGLIDEGFTFEQIHEAIEQINEISSKKAHAASNAAREEANSIRNFNSEHEYGRDGMDAISHDYSRQANHFLKYARNKEANEPARKNTETSDARLRRAKVKKKS